MRSHRTYLPSPVSKSFPQRGIRPAAPRPPFLQLQEPCGISLSPLTDSNRRPPPHHQVQAATNGNPPQRIRLVTAGSGRCAFATDCHWLRPLGSTNAPFWRRESLMRNEGSSHLPSSGQCMTRSVERGSIGSLARIAPREAVAPTDHRDEPLTVRGAVGPAIRRARDGDAGSVAVRACMLDALTGAAWRAVVAARLLPSSCRACRPQRDSRARGCGNRPLDVGVSQTSLVHREEGSADVVERPVGCLDDQPYRVRAIVAKPEPIECCSPAVTHAGADRVFSVPDQPEQSVNMTDARASALFRVCDRVLERSLDQHRPVAQCLGVCSSFACRDA